MAQPPDLPPESVMLGAFKGLRNTIGRERLGPDELETAVNVDIDDAKQLHRRRGYTQVGTGSYHSLYTSSFGLFAVKDFMLGVVNPDYSFRTLQFAGADPVAYVQVGDVVYFSSRAVSGKVTSDFMVMPWGQVGGDGTWLSPVISPEDGLAPVAGKLLRAPTLSTVLTYFNGRIYLAAGKTVWATELYNYDLVDATKNFLQFEDNVTVMGTVTDGIYVGTEQNVYFLSGPKFPLSRIAVMNYGAYFGSLQVVPAELFIPEQQRPAMISKNAVTFMTKSGLVVGFDNGVLNNLTQSTVLFPDANTVSALFRRQDGVNQYIGVFDSAGTPTTNARIGDYVDAEIRRFSGA